MPASNPCQSGVAMLLLLVGCSSHPGYRDCGEWNYPDFVPLEGELHMEFSARSVGTSPPYNFTPHGWHDENGAHVYGCALLD